MTTTPLLTAGPRLTEPICPAWCAGHNETYQSWEELDAGWVRYHGGNDRLLYDVAIECMAVEDSSGVLAPATISVYVDNGGTDADLTPEQATEVAQRVLEYAKLVTAHNEARR